MLIRKAIPFMALLVVAGCSGQSGRLLPADTAEAGDPAPTEAGSEQPEPSAADGTDVGACFDGTCEVEISKPIDIPMDEKFGLGDFSVSEVGPDGIEFSVVFPGGSGGGHVSLGGVGSIGVFNGISMTIVAFSGENPIVRFAPQ
jgi:hypothetical protein